MLFFILLWLLGSVISFILFAHVYAEDFGEFRVSHAIFFGVLCLVASPAALLFSIVIWSIDCGPKFLSGLGFENKVLLKRKVK